MITLKCIRTVSEASKCKKKNFSNVSMAVAALYVVEMIYKAGISIGYLRWHVFEFMGYPVKGMKGQKGYRAFPQFSDSVCLLSWGSRNDNLRDFDAYC